MKVVILITVIESLAVMLAILYFYYRRSQSGKRALVRGHRSITKQAKLVLPPGDYSQQSLPNQSGHSDDSWTMVSNDNDKLGLKRMALPLSFQKSNVEGKNSKIKKVDQAKRWVQFTAR